MERNLRFLPVHQILASSLVWLPVFVLFTRARFDLDGALLLASLYYFFVVALEVPSGWMSDRLGRVITLRIAALCWIGAQAFFAIGGDSFGLIMLGQLFLAGGFASLSGTDVTFHYDTLEELALESEYVQRQARLSSIGYGATALSAVVGGSLGLIDVRWAFAVACVVAVAQFGVTLLLSEPSGGLHAEPFVQQLRLCLGYLRERYLGWIFFYGVIMVTLAHVAFTLMQPWLTEVLGNNSTDIGATPLLSGLLFAAVSLFGAAAARSSAPLSERFGVVLTLIGMAAVSALIVTAMALSTHVAVLGVVVFRSAQGAVAPVLISAAVAERTERHHRATLLSMNSLAGRLGYGLVLLWVSAGAVDDAQRVLGLFSLVAWILVAVLVATAALAIGTLRVDGEHR
ncbi:MAG: MFS transporter [Acidimicrobiales bacterium]